MDNKIFDYEFDSRPGEIPLGRIDRTAFEKTINEFGSHLMIASLYMQGEPLLSKEIYNMIGYNYRLPNINAAIGCAQLEQIELFLKSIK